MNWKLSVTTGYEVQGPLCQEQTCTMYVSYNLCNGSCSELFIVVISNLHNGNKQNGTTQIRTSNPIPAKLEWLRVSWPEMNHRHCDSVPCLTTVVCPPPPHKMQVVFMMVWLFFFFAGWAVEWRVLSLQPPGPGIFPLLMNLNYAKVTFHCADLWAALLELAAFPHHRGRAY